MWSSRQRLLALVFTLLGGVAWWLLEHQPEDEALGPPRPRAPDYVVSDFQALETDSEGRPDRQLTAEQMRQFVGEDLAELDLPNLTLYQEGGPPWRIQSREGLVLGGGSEVQLRDAVRVERGGSEGNRSVRLDTSELTVWPQRQFAQGDRPVQVVSDHDWLTAQGVQLWYATPMRAEFIGRAHLHIAPDDGTARETSPPSLPPQTDEESTP